MIDKIILVEKVSLTNTHCSSIFHIKNDHIPTLLPLMFGDNTGNEIENESTSS